MKIGFTELLMVFVVALLVLGPDKLPSFAKKLGAGLREFRKASGDITKELKESVIDPLEEAQEPLREAMKPLDDLGHEVNANLKDVTKSLENLGKAKPAPEKQAEAAEPGPPLGEVVTPEPDAAPEPDEVVAEEAPERTPNGPDTENGGTDL